MTGNSAAQLRAIVARASTLRERLEGPYVCAKEPTGADGNGIERWKHSLGDTDGKRLECRLLWEGVGLDPVAAAWRLGAVRLCVSAPLPPWTDVLAAYAREARVVRRLLSESAMMMWGSCDRALREGDPVPFEEILLPFIRVARARLRRILQSEREAFTETAYADLERSLLRELSRFAEETLYFEFRVRRTARASLGALSKCYVGTYRTFVTELLEDPLAGLLLRYAALARILCIRLMFWVDNTAALARRCARDRQALGATFNQGADPGRVSGVSSPLSDSHRGGRTVRIVSFESGLQVVYKPRPLDPEAAFYGLVQWSGVDLPLRLRALRVLTRPGYGWMEWVPGDPCLNSAAVARCYRRSGSMLALAYVLGASDLHHENIIASGDEVFAVDLEVMPSTPITPPSLVSWPQHHLANGFWETVLRTWLLPVRTTAFVAAYVPEPVMDAAAESATRWVATNTDWMKKRASTRPAAAMTNLPLLDGERVLPFDHIEEIVRGFHEMYRLLMVRKQELLSPDGPLAPFLCLFPRVIVRSTRSYALLLGRLCRPELLETGVDQSLALEVLRRHELDGSKKPPLWDVHKSEESQLLAMDVPYFVASATASDLLSGDGRRVGQFRSMPATQKLTERVANLSQYDLERQIALIRVAFQAAGVRRANRLGEEQGGASASIQDGASSHAWALEEATALGDGLRAIVLEEHDGPSWYGHRIGADGAVTFDRLDLDLAHGVSGLLLFFAALARVGAGDRFENIARRVLHLIAHRGFGSERSLPRLAARGSLGAGAGLGGIVYALLRSASWLRDECALETASRVARLLAPDVIVADTVFDVHGGGAGAILGLLALAAEQEARDVEWALETATALGRNLLARRVTDRITGLRAWSGSDGRVHSGFAHGASGIAYALARLQQCAGFPAFREAAEEALEFEHRLFAPELENWYETAEDARASLTPEKLWATWCHGASGIGLARVGVARAGVDAASVAEIEAAARTTRTRLSETSLDHLCCGNFGRIAFLAAAERDGYIAAAAGDTTLELARTVVDRARGRTIYRLGGDPTFQPGFLQGTSGIGYQLLQLVRPDALPDALLLT